MTPRPHQVMMLDAVAAGWKEFRRQLVVCPTGGGKTPFFAWEAQRHFPERTLILAHREELISQAVDKVYAAIGVGADVEKAERHARRAAPVVVGSVQTLCRPDRLAAWAPDHFALVVVDEAHHALADSYQRILKHFDGAARVLGVTATPSRSDSRNLGEYFENIACQIPLFTREDNPIPGLVDSKMLVPIKVYQSPLKIDLSSVGLAMDAESGCRDFKKDEAASALVPYLSEIAKEIKRVASDRRVLGFAPLIATAQKAAAACTAAGLRAEFIYGEDPDRAEKQRAFRDWELDILWNAQLLTEGYDDPGIDCIVPLRPTKSASFYAQQIGRGTRLDGPLKENLLIIDFLWLTAKHRLCRPACLIAQSEEEERAIEEVTEDRAKGLPADIAEQLPLDLKDLAGAATAKREENLRKKLEEHRNKKGKFISAEEFAIQHHRVDVAEFVPVMKWERDGVTESQAKWLKRAHIDPATVRGKGHASRLLSLFFGSQKLQLASVGQRRIMARMGHPNADQATAAEARQFFAGLKTKNNHN